MSGFLAIPMIIELLRSAYEIEATDIVPVDAGLDLNTRKWVVTTSASKLFVKEYLSDIHRAPLLLSLALAEFALDGGIPVPRIFRTVTGQLLCEHDESMVAAFDYVADANVYSTLSLQQAAFAGAMLGKIHSRFRVFPAALEHLNGSWFEFRLDHKMKEIDRYLRKIDAIPELSDFDRQARDLLHEQQGLLDRIPMLLDALPPLTSQVIHGDYNPQNLLFRSGLIAAVVDFRPPRPFLVAYELGRIALNPEHFQQSDWSLKALAATEGYCRSHDPNKADFVCSFRIWLIQLLRSTYGIKEHYLSPVRHQTTFDAYWINRRKAAPIILSALPDLESELARVWDAHCD
jgi:Ser/Thr protein kinase RdoA (MazF antagonist)